MTRKEAIENIRKHFDYMQEWITPKEVLKVALEALEQPEIVRCNDCERLIENGCGGGDDMCAREGFPVSKNDYCSFAERRVKT